VVLLLIKELGLCTLELLSKCYVTERVIARWVRLEGVAEGRKTGVWITTRQLAKCE
jgi:hypothetical protein